MMSMTYKFNSHIWSWRQLLLHFKTLSTPHFGIHAYLWSKVPKNNDFIHFGYISQNTFPRVVEWNISFSKANMVKAYTLINVTYSFFTNGTLIIIIRSFMPDGNASSFSTRSYMTANPTSSSHSLLSALPSNQ